jgi:hypothetical protein
MAASSAPGPCQSCEPSLTAGLLNGSEAQVSSPRVSKGSATTQQTYGTLTRPYRVLCSRQTLRKEDFLNLRDCAIKELPFPCATRLIPESGWDLLPFHESFPVHSLSH